jgi:hypothetical protein
MHTNHKRDLEEAAEAAANVKPKLPAPKKGKKK